MAQRELKVSITLTLYNGGRYSTDTISDSEIEDMIQWYLWEELPYDGVNVLVETVKPESENNANQA